VADAPVAALLGRTEELSRRWAIALLRERSLEQVAQVSLQRLAQVGPDLCRQLSQALASEEGLAALAGEGSGALPSEELLALAGGEDARAVVATVEALRGVLWEATLEELRDPSARQVADLADRLSFLCAGLLGAVLAEGSAPGRRSGHAPAAPPSRGQVLYSAPQPAPGRRGAVLIDERDDAPAAAPARPAARPARREAEPPAPAAGRPLPWDTPLQPSPASAAAPREQIADAGEGELRVTRRRGAPVERRS
jgi:hypothetical protein